MIISHSILAAIAGINVLVAYQDFKNRLISAWIIPVLIVLFVAFQWISDDLIFLKEHLLLNLVYLGIIMLGIILYSYLKFKAFVNPFDKLIGWGDILLILTFAFVFETKSFIVFVTLSSILSLVLAIVIKFKSPEKKIQFPFAGMMSIVFLILGVVCLFNAPSALSEYFQSAIF